VEQTLRNVPRGTFSRSRLSLYRALCRVGNPRRQGPRDQHLKNLNEQNEGLVGFVEVFHVEHCAILAEDIS